MDTAGAAWSRMVTYELRVNYLVEEVIARRLDEACIAYRQSEGPLFSMTWEGPGRRKDVPLRRAAYDLLEA